MPATISVPTYSNICGLTVELRTASITLRRWMTNDVMVVEILCCFRPRDIQRKNYSFAAAGKEIYGAD